MDVGELPPLPTRPGPVGERDRLALTLGGRLMERKGKRDFESVCLFFFF